MTNDYVYDGWNLIAVFNPQDSVLQSFAWGQDLSGTMDQAWGVGGLLMASISGTNCFPAYDGNGNIMALVNAGDYSTGARYEYSPFGQLIRSTGPLASSNPFRFSTKFWDEESGLAYYGYRFYSPNLGRWINRDPGWENNGINLYGFAENCSIASIDTNGKSTDYIEVAIIAKDIAEWAHTLLHVFENPPSGLYGYFSGWIAAPFKFPPLEMMRIEMGSEMQEMKFMENSKNLIVNRLEEKAAINYEIGINVGAVAAEINDEGGNGDDYILNVATDAAGTAGVDSAEAIYGDATDIEHLLR